MDFSDNYVVEVPVELRINISRLNLIQWLEHFERREHLSFDFDVVFFNVGVALHEIQHTFMRPLIIAKINLKIILLNS